MLRYRVSSFLKVNKYSNNNKCQAELVGTRDREERVGCTHPQWLLPSRSRPPPCLSGGRGRQGGDGTPQRTPRHSKVGNTYRETQKYITRMLPTLGCVQLAPVAPKKKKTKKTPTVGPTGGPTGGAVFEFPLISGSLPREPRLFFSF